MNTHELTEKLIEMFPNIKRRDAENLAATGDDISILITRILDGNIEGPTIDIRELASKQTTRYYKTTEYNYPEVFKNNLFVNMHICISDCRAKALKLYERASILTESAITHNIKIARSHFSIEADNLRDQARELNREAAIVIMKRSLESVGPIDLHGLFVDEALKFLDDLYYFRRFKDIVFITGREYNSSKLRPAVTNWLIKKGFKVINDGASVNGIKIEYK